MVVFVAVRMAMIHVLLSCSEFNMTDSSGVDFLQRQILDVSLCSFWEFRPINPFWVGSPLGNPGSTADYIELLLMN